MLIDFRILFPKYNIKPTGILHIGANIGEEAPVYLELGIKRQIWIEANPEIYEKLVNNISGNKDAFALNYAIGDIDNCFLPLHVSNNGSQSSSILELGTHLQAHPDVHYIKDIQVEMRTIESIFKSLCCPIDSDIGPEEIERIASNLDVKNYDFINIDIQGAELKALKGMGDLLHGFKWIYSEVNCREVYKGCALVGDLDLYLSGFGFRRVETFNAGGFFERLGWSDALYVKG